ncbi:prominin-1-A isoform X1 [Frankliniella occidentalis]|uniref:Prominin-1-A isoform X1 n=1 Tax=Frankliniella occidentalis TaxID=133901 RepID=A0A6J1S5H9_FRAOC|nr:prominin-1-A isoform X1 [Frankliniella occidentalis]
MTLCGRLARAGLWLALLAVALEAVTATEYSPPLLNHSYVARAAYDDHAMQTLYNIARKVLRGVQRPAPFPPGLFVVEGDRIETKLDGTADVISYYGGVVAIVVVGLIVAVAVPCGGFLWCLCGGGCKCSSGKVHKRGGRPQQSDAELDHAEHREPGPCFVPAALGVTACVIAAGACLTLATNAYMDKGIIAFPNHISTGIDDVTLFADNSIVEVNTFFENNYDELSDALNLVLSSGNKSISSIVNNIYKALPVETLNTISNGLVDISKDLTDISKNGGEVVKQSQDIAKVVKEVKDSISTKCPGSACQTIIDALDTQTFPALPDLSTSISSLNPFVDASFKSSLEAGVKQVDEMADKANQYVDETIKSINSEIVKTRQELQKTSKELIEQVQSVKDSINDINDKVDSISDDFEKYDGYKNGGLIVVGLVYMLIAVAIMFGLVSGCCSKHNSYAILKLPTWFIFLTTFVLMIFTTAAFLVGLVGDRVCEAVREPENNEIINLFDTLITKTQSDKHVTGNITYYIRACQKNETIYNVLNLDSTVKIDEIHDLVNKFKFDDFLTKIEKAQDKIKNANLIPEDIKQELDQLENSDLANLNLDDIKNKVQTGNGIVGKLNPTEWASELEQIGQQAKVDFTTETEKLRGQESNVKLLQSTVAELTRVVEKLEKDSRLGADNFLVALKSLVSQIQDAEKSVKAVDFVPVADQTATKFKGEVDQYLTYVISRVKNDALRCGPLSRVFDSLVVASCDEVLGPWNGFWAASGTCLLFFIPAAILAINLSSRRD